MLFEINGKLITLKNLNILAELDSVLIFLVLDRINRIFLLVASGKYRELDSGLIYFLWVACGKDMEIVGFLFSIHRIRSSEKLSGFSLYADADWAEVDQEAGFFVQCREVVDQLYFMGFGQVLDGFQF